MAEMKTVQIKLVKSGIGTPKDQKATLRGLGLTRLNQVRQLQDTPMIRGMIFKVRHLVVAEPPTATKFQVAKA